MAVNPVTKTIYVANFGRHISFWRETSGADGAKTLHILELHDLADKTVRQWWRQSTDNRKTWTTVWDAIYVSRTRQ